MHASRPDLRARLIGLASRALHGAGPLTLARSLANRKRNAQILIYHRVNDEQDPYFAAVPTGFFERQMAYLASHFTVLPLDDLVRGLPTGDLPPNAVSVTFDDGYRDNYLNAFPILRRHAIPASIFLTTSAIGSTRPVWHDDVFSAFRETTVASLEPFGPRSIGGSLGTVADRLRVQREVLRDLRAVSDEERAEGVIRIREALRVGPARDVPGLMLSWDDVREMHRAGIRFGSHTATHPILSRVDAARARRELVDSRSAIEEHLGAPVAGFAYPNGTRADFLPETKALLRETGYEYAVSTEGGTNDAQTDLFELRRGTPWEQDVFAFGMRLLYNKWRS